MTSSIPRDWASGRRSNLREQRIPPAALTRDHGGEDFLKIGRRWVETFHLFGGLEAHHHVLDVGCGPGRMALALAERFGELGRYEGFDIRPADISWCRREIEPHWPRSRFRHVDLRNPLYNPRGTLSPVRFDFPYEDGVFDFVFLTSVFTHVTPPVLCNYLGEISRVLRQGGRCLMTLWLLSDANRRVVRAGDARFSFRYELERHCWSEFADDLVAVAYEERFVQEVCEMAGLSPTSWHPGSWTGVEMPSPPRHSQDVVVTTRTAPAARRLRALRLRLEIGREVHGRAERLARRWVPRPVRARLGRLPRRRSRT